MFNKLFKSIMNTIAERAKTKDEIKAIVYGAFDVLYVILDYETYTKLFEEVQLQVEALYDVYIF